MCASLSELHEILVDAVQMHCHGYPALLWLATIHRVTPVHDEVENEGFESIWYLNDAIGSARDQAAYVRNTTRK